MAASEAGAADDSPSSGLSRRFSPVVNRRVNIMLQVQMAQDGCVRSSPAQPEVFVPSHLTRKELLKQDKFAVEVGQTVDFFAVHRKQVTQYGGAALVLALIVAGGLYYRNSQAVARQSVLGDAIALTSAPVSQAPSPNGAVSFPSDAAKRDAITKAFTKIAADYSGEDEGYIAEYFLAGQAADTSNWVEARKKYQDVADHASANYASLAKLALAQIDFSENRNSEAESLLKDLIDHPTDMVSKAQATITLAKGIGQTRPDEARKMLQALVTPATDVSPIASAAIAALPQK